jgi:prepilin-type N-terminal cleavage/methylation domain-containing protein
MRIRNRRSGFTLLEVMLASAIAVLMMAALYVAIQVQIREMDEGRSRVDRTALARAIFNRVSQDLAPSLSPIAPTPTSNSSSSNSSGTGTATTEPNSMTTTTTSPFVFQIGVRGDGSQVSIYLTRLNRSLVAPADAANAPVGCDIRRITYYWASGRGLMRQEIRAVTMDDVEIEPTAEDENSLLLASEIEEFTVSYFDGTSYVDSWDGSQPGPDGTTPMGPPRAIKITLSIRLVNEEEPKTFSHVIAIPAAPGAAPEQ